MSLPTRRQVVAGLIGGLGSALIAGCMPLAHYRTSARVIVIGGGFAGMTCARTLNRLSPGTKVTLVEPGPVYHACPLSNLVIAGQREPGRQTFTYQILQAEGISHLQQAAVDIDPVRRRISLTDGSIIDYDRLVIAPGISFNFDALPGYSKQAALRMPHAWQAGDQTLRLASQLKAMPNGGTFVMAIPANPYRCPPGPYERASLVAHYLRTHKSRSKVLLLDGKDNFSKQSLFQAAWAEHYGELIEWQGLSDGARVVSVDADTNTLYTDFDRVQADVANVIPPQRAGKIAHIAGVADNSGWCPVTAETFASTRVPDTHVIGDAAIANAMPKSAFAANVQGKLCAAQLARLLDGQPPISTRLINTCYSLVTPEEGISVAGVYRPSGDRWIELPGAGGTSPPDAGSDFRRLEAAYAYDWFDTITREVWG
ncbi:MAG: FCSD flavin-binding domain-containing protein [Pseudomonadota bacterium]